MANSSRKCCNCKKFFPVESGIVAPIGFFHSDKCRRDYAFNKTKTVIKKAKEGKQKEYRAKKRNFQNSDIKLRKSEAQKAFNAYIRERDKGKGCISCGTNKPDTQYCAGHFFTRGARSDLAFNEDNVHLQCNQYCNMRLSGNIGQYKPRLIEKIGIDRFKALEVVKTVKRSAEDYKEIELKYKKKLKELKQKAPV